MKSRILTMKLTMTSIISSPSPSSRPVITGGSGSAAIAVPSVNCVAARAPVTCARNLFIREWSEETFSIIQGEARDRKSISLSVQHLSLCVSVNKAHCDDDERRQREPDVPIESHKLQQGGASGQRRCLRHAAACGEYRECRDNEPRRTEAVQRGVHDIQNGAGFTGVQNADPAAADEDDDAQREEENLRERRESGIHRKSHAREERFRSSHESREYDDDAFRGDDRDERRDDDLDGLLSSDDEDIAHRDCEEDDDEEIPADGHHRKHGSIVGVIS